MKKLLIIGVVALVVVGCVLAAGCTSNTATTDDFAVGTWTTDDGEITVVLTNDYHGVYINGNDITDVVWKKTADGKYTLMRGDEIQENVTIDKNKGILTNEAGTALTKVLVGTNVAQDLADKLEEIEDNIKDKKEEIKDKFNEIYNEYIDQKEDLEYEQTFYEKAEEQVRKLKEQVKSKVN